MWTEVELCGMLIRRVNPVTETPESLAIGLLLVRAMRTLDEIGMATYDAESEWVGSLAREQLDSIRKQLKGGDHAE